MLLGLGIHGASLVALVLGAPAPRPGQSEVFLVAGLPGELPADKPVEALLGERGRIDRFC